MSPDPLRSPHSALDLQLELLRIVGDRLADHVRRVTRLDHGVHGIDMEVDQSTVRRIPTAALPAQAQAAVAGLGGWTMWIGAEVVPIIEQAAQSIPPPDAGSLALAGVIPDSAGTMWLAGDPLMIEASTGSGEALPVIGVSWSIEWVDGAAVDGGGAPALILWPWLRDSPWPVLGSVGVVAVGADVGPLVEFEMPDEVRQVDLAESWSDPVTEMVRFVLAAWVMCGQVMPTHIESATRPQMRRAKRLPARPRIEWGEVHVTTLRRAGLDPSGHQPDDDADRHWSHRWVVRGHWRWQPCGPGRQQRRLVWVRPHVKGPEGAPLMEVEQVAKLVR